jgi:hypothetical protein
MECSSTADMNSSVVGRYETTDGTPDRNGICGGGGGDDGAHKNRGPCRNDRTRRGFGWLGWTSSFDANFRTILILLIITIVSSTSLLSSLRQGGRR